MKAWSIVLALVAIGASCSPPELEPLPPGSFAFGVFGDGPYSDVEVGRFLRVIREVNTADLQWVVHVGDILGRVCSDEMFEDRLAALNAIQHPVIYTPGDNEWTDCHTIGGGSYAPLDRLSRIRQLFFARPGTTLGARTMTVETQARDSVFGEFVENVRWKYGGFVFATLHMVGSGNASEDFPGRTPEDDRAMERRKQAAVAWAEDAFRFARTEGAKGVVLAMHGDPGLGGDPEAGYGTFLQRLEELVGGFSGPVLLIHGDSHIERVDHSLTDPRTGQPLPNFTRLETFGSPRIGWIRVVVDSTAGRIVGFEPRLMHWLR